MACSCGKVLYTCPYASTKKTGIFGFPQLIHCSFHTCRFQWFSPEHRDSLWHPGQNSSPLLPHSHISDILNTQLWKQETTGTDWWPEKLKWNIIFFFPPLAQSKAFLDEGELNNFSQKLVFTTPFSSTDHTQDQPGFTWTHQQFHRSKALRGMSECVWMSVIHLSDTGRVSDCTMLTVSLLSEKYC